jgi:hypothetical protein
MSSLDKEVSIEGTRALLLVAKLLQNLSNGVEFDGSKEEYMTRMNDFITKNAENTAKFLDSLTVRHLLLFSSLPFHFTSGLRFVCLLLERRRHFPKDEKR